MYLHVIYKFPTNFIDFLRKKNFNFQIQLNMWISDQPGAYVTQMNRIFVTSLTCKLNRHNQETKFNIFYLLNKIVP